MRDSAIFDRTIQVMHDRLNLNSVNQELISSNLANINTPGYAAKDISFEQTLRESLEEQPLHLARSQDQHLDPTDLHLALKSPEITETGAVDLEWEMMKLTKNSVEYQYIVTMLNKKFAMLRTAIGEGAQ